MKPYPIINRKDKHFLFLPFQPSKRRPEGIKAKSPGNNRQKKRETQQDESATAETDQEPKNKQPYHIRKGDKKHEKL